MKLIKNIINNMKIRTKLIISYLSIVIVTVLIVGVYLTSRMNNIVVENAIKEGRYNNNSKMCIRDSIWTMAYNFIYN